jgi:zona occludens toxin (predicted ATPase)
MDDKLKWILLAVGGYFLYDWYTKQAPATEGGDAAAAAAAAKAASDAAIAKAAATQTAADAAEALRLKAIADAAEAIRLKALDDARKQSVDAEDTPIRQMTDAQVAALAASIPLPSLVAAESDRRGLKLNHHQWNWYREQYTKTPQPDPEFWAPGHTGDVVTVTQYLTARAAVAGMSGLGRWSGPILPWSTAWSA